MTFQVGDRVRAIQAYDGNYDIVGRYGTVRSAGTYECAIEFDDAVEGHDLGGSCQDRHGWNVGPECLEHVSTYEGIRSIGDFFRHIERAEVTS